MFEAAIIIVALACAGLIALDYIIECFVEWMDGGEE